MSRKPTNRLLYNAFGYRASYYVKRPHRFIREIWWILKHFWQRGTRGWSDVDVFSLDYYIAEIMPQMLRALAQDNISTPMSFCKQAGDDRYDVECDHEAWVKYLNELADAYDEYRAIINGDVDEKNPYSNDSYTEVLSKIKRNQIEVMTNMLFDHFPELWS